MHFRTLMELTWVKHIQQEAPVLNFCETEVKLGGSNFISVMADGRTDQGVTEEVLFYLHYVTKELGKPVNEYFAI